MSLFYGELRQVAYVVHDIERAMAYWSRAMGVGPWFYNEHVGVTEFSYYGKPSALPDLSIALANSGGVQVELIQQRNDAPSLYRDFLLLSVATDDADPAAEYEQDPLMELSEKASGKTHPAVIALFPIADEPEGGAAITKNDLDQLTLAVKAPDRVYGFVLEGHGDLP